MKLKSILPSIIIGNVFEWYDFCIYGYMASVITKIFFPNISPSMALIATFSIFLTGYIARPFGSVVFGYLADRSGRKSTLTISILLMAFSTSIIGLLPTYATAGVLACIALTICRVVQGFAIGGEFTLSVAYLIEHAPDGKKGFFGSCTFLGAFIGLFLGSISITALHSLFTESEISSYAWRIPFVLSIVFGFIGIFLRLKLPETPVFQKLISSNKYLERNPFTHVMFKSPIKLIIAVGLTFLGSCSFSLWFIWLPAYLKVHSQLSNSYILLVNSINLLIVTLLIPLFGHISDKFGVKVVLLSAAIGTFVFAIPLIMLINSLQLLLIWIGQLGLSIFLSMVYGTIPITLYKLFPAFMRCSGISISYNLANMLFGGSMPVIASTIAANTNNLLYQSIPVMFAAIVMILIITNLSKFKIDLQANS